LVSLIRNRSDDFDNATSRAQSTSIFYLFITKFISYLDSKEQLAKSMRSELPQEDDDETLSAVLRSSSSPSSSSSSCCCCSNNNATCRKRILIVAWLLCIALVIVDTYTHKYLEHGVQAYLVWLSTHPLRGVLSVIGVYIIATVCFVPGSILTLGVGFAFRGAFGNHAALSLAMASGVSKT
jgi:hypothetical protein